MPAMATEPPTAASESPARPDPSDREPNLLRFGLRPWFYFISAVAIFCALMARLEGLWATAVAFVGALIGAHLFGAFLGTRLRDTSADVRRWRGRLGTSDRDEPVALPQPVNLRTLQLPETTPLAASGVRVWWNRWAILLGGTAGTGLGAVALWSTRSTDVTTLGLLLGALSAGVIGAWIAMLASNFWNIARQAWRHANDRD